MKKKNFVIFLIIGLILCACGSYREKSADTDENAEKENEYKATLEKAEENIDEDEAIDHFPDINTDTIEYAYISVDQDVYPDLDSLLEVADLIFKGKVKKHTYVEVGYESWIPIDEKVDLESEYTICTQYEIEVEQVYYGNAVDTIDLTMFAVPMNYEKEMQVKIIKEAAEILGSTEKIVKYLPVPKAWNDFRVADGDEYLFCLRKCNDKWITVDYGQGIYRLDDSGLKDHWGYLSAEEIMKALK